jgi:peptidoglycan/LPS O-acetylase OafA/YrhL
MKLRKIVEGPGLFRFLLAFAVVVSHSTRLQLGKGAVLVFFTLIGISIAGGIPPSVFNTHEILSNLFLLGYHQLPWMPVDAAWSLDIEMQFYVIAPLLFMLADHGSRKAWLALLAISAFVSIAFWEDSQTTLIQTIAFFAIGATASGTGWKPDRRLGWLSLVGTTVIVCGLALSPWQGIVLGGKVPTELYYRFDMDFNILVALLIAPWAIYTTKQTGARSDGMIGDLSYIVYLIHMQILTLFDSANGTVGHRLVMTSGAYVVILALAWLVWRLFDHPVNRRRSRWVSRRLSKMRGVREMPQSA